MTSPDGDREAWLAEFAHAKPSLTADPRPVDDLEAGSFYDDPSYFDSLPPTAKLLVVIIGKRGEAERPAVCYDMSEELWRQFNVFKEPDALRLVIALAALSLRYITPDVSNFGAKHIQEFIDQKVPVPTVNQIDLHPFMRHPEIVKICEDNGILLEAWGPLARAMRFNHSVVQSVAKKHGKDEAQIMLRWGLQHGFVVIPKSVSPKRIKSNSEIFDFEISPEDMKELDALDEYLTDHEADDTEEIYIPSVFVSRASFLVLRDMIANGTSSGHSEGPGLWVELSEGSDEGGLLSFALLMPSMFLLATIAVHRVRVARQREADRAPALVVLSLPERVWTPDIIWEKDDESDAASVSSRRSRTSPTTSITNVNTSPAVLPADSVSGPDVPPPPPISPSDIRTPPAVQLSIPGESSDPARPSSSRHDSQQRKKKRSKSGGKKYFSKDECAICMDSFQKGEVVRILLCGHVFHKEECDEWLMKWRKLCPTCRADVTLPSAAVSGTTLTPVAPPSTGVEVEQPPPPFLSRLNASLATLRTRLFGRGSGSSTPTAADETTPLMSDGGARRTEGIV